MAGGVGNDTYTVDVATDVVTEALTAGTDSVVASLNYTLGANVENLTLAGAALTGTGNTLNNVLTGNALNNLLSGLAGSDQLDGGAGNDRSMAGRGRISSSGGGRRPDHHVGHARQRRYHRCRGGQRYSDPQWDRSG